jgi:hypothetical protein
MGRERMRQRRRTSASERSTVQGLVVHGRIIGENVAIRVVVVPAGTMRAEKGEWLRRWGRDGRLAEEAESARWST